MSIDKNLEYKTTESWFLLLPDVERFLAISYTSKDKLLELRSSVWDALLCSFAWQKTPQGYSYWYNVGKKFKND